MGKRKIRTNYRQRKLRGEREGRREREGDQESGVIKLATN